jgi:hypothetical protein
MAGRPTESRTGEKMRVRGISMLDSDWAECKRLGGAAWVRSQLRSGRGRRALTFEEGIDIAIRAYEAAIAQLRQPTVPTMPMMPTVPPKPASKLFVMMATNLAIYGVSLSTQQAALMDMGLRELSELDARPGLIWDFSSRIGEDFDAFLQADNAGM